MKRTATCGELSSKNVGDTVVLNGWVHRNRDHGGIHFINLRDRYGITQVVIDENAGDDLKKLAGELKFEYCIAVKGVVQKRPDSMINKEMVTGEIEIIAGEAVVLSTCHTLPFVIDGDNQAREELRLQYRYLDLRREQMQRNIRVRHEVTFSAREYLISQGFYEIETPTFIKSTPEGARDFLVPSRVNPGKFYALPQSPQLYKQLLMVSGYDKYFQIARCYRDEDSRGDRQPEFTQIDLEMSFVSRDDILNLTEGLMQYIFKKVLDVEVPGPFLRMTYDDALNTYGSDKPDLRFALPIRDFAPVVPKGDFQVFKSVLESGGSVKVLCVPGCSGYSRKQIQELEEAAKTYGAKGLAWMKVTKANTLDGGISKFYTSQTDTILSLTDAKPDDLLLFIGDSWKTTCTALGAVRNKLGRDLSLIDNDEYKFLWIIDFPLFEWNEDENKWDPSHHMFSMPQEQYLETLKENPGAVKGDLYDLVLNGSELASGSIRVHNPDIQQQIFDIVGFSTAEARKRFGFLLNAFNYGPPPHGGIAPGLDRLVAIMTGSENIREVIAFPKNTAGQSPMDESPSEVENTLLDDLYLELKKIETKD